MAVREIALLGNPVLRKKCSPVRSFDSSETRECIRDLRDTLAQFRVRNGFGRGIAAPQIGTSKQMLYVDFDFRGALINPSIVKRSKKTFTMWDDCFSFPDILVKLERHYSISVSYQDAGGKRNTLEATGELSELLQHEIDHLQGILAIDRAIDSRHIILRSEIGKLSRKRAMTL